MPNYVGMPASMHLDLFGRVVTWAFHEIPYLVGSATTEKVGWRDVDVRLILPDEAFEELDVGKPGDNASNERWTSLCMAYSALGQKMTGLPIDFQIQQRTYANTRYGRDARVGERIPLGIFPLARRDNEREEL